MSGICGLSLFLVQLHILLGSGTGPGALELLIFLSRLATPSSLMRRSAVGLDCGSLGSGFVSICCVEAERNCFTSISAMDLANLLLRRSS